ncbi:MULTISPECIES: TIGR04206 family protein [Halobacterium]|uniref:TIGR04206 family protein n=1 Tax=Halobacterium TaxID=2239 RepID=UPI0019638C5D|nr:MULTISPECIES: TIGR04206 family protein [Halobacterium]MDL0145426.1 TIGR04206 family protein [Halobacterium salinarum]QRY23542.1 TIGR04206 family protein [Halobacterium sp. GSL-19]
MPTARRRVVAVALAAGVVPWVIVDWSNGAYPLFSVGFVYPESMTVVGLPTYLRSVGTVPPALRAWPTAVALWGGGVAAAALDVDWRVTAGVLAFAGGSVVSLAAAVTAQPSLTGVPVGAGALWLAAGYVAVVGRGR